MDETEDVTHQSSDENGEQEFIDETSQEEEVVESPSSAERKLEEKVIPYDRFQEVVKENKKLKERTKSAGALDVGDYIDISASLEGLDQKEKEYLAKQHKLSGEPLKDIRKSEDFTLWQSAYRQKVEKEQLSLKPSGTQSESDRPMSFTERLKNASISEKEELLEKAGFYKSPRPRQDQVNIGRGGK